MSGDNVIFEYSDKQGLDDGVLVNISCLDIEIDGKPVNIMTNTLFTDHFSSDLKLAAEALGPAVECAVDEEGDKYMYTTQLEDGTDIWLVANGSHGYTAMRPKDY